jgi:hypothetical protein
MIYFSALLINHLLLHSCFLLELFIEFNKLSVFIFKMEHGLAFLLIIFQKLSWYILILFLQLFVFFNDASFFILQNVYLLDELILIFGGYRNLIGKSLHLWNKGFLFFGMLPSYLLNDSLFAFDWFIQFINFPGWLRFKVLNLPFLGVQLFPESGC